MQWRITNVSIINIGHVNIVYIPTENKVKMSV